MFLMTLLVVQHQYLFDIYKNSDTLLLSNMSNIIISSCTVKSVEHGSYPNGSLVATGTVHYADNKKPWSEYTETKIKDVKVVNCNNVDFFGSARTDGYSADALRAIAHGLLDIADLAEQSHTKLIAFNK